MCTINVAACSFEWLEQILKKMIQIAHISLQLRSYNMGVCLSSQVHTTCHLLYNTDHATWECVSSVAMRD